MDSFTVRMLAAERVFYQGPCESLVVPTSQGMYGVQAHHCSMISAIVPGTLTYRIPEEQNQYVSVGSGILKVHNNEVLILADLIMLPEELVVYRRREQEAKEKEEKLQQQAALEYRMTKMEIGRDMMKLRRGKQHETL